MLFQSEFITLISFTYYVQYVQENAPPLPVGWMPPEPMRTRWRPGSPGSSRPPPARRVADGVGAGQEGEEEARPVLWVTSSPAGSSPTRGRSGGQPGEEGGGDAITEIQG